MRKCKFSEKAKLNYLNCLSTGALLMWQSQETTHDYLSKYNCNFDDETKNVVTKLNINEALVIQKKWVNLQNRRRYSCDRSGAFQILIFKGNYVFHSKE